MIEHGEERNKRKERREDFRHMLVGITKVCTTVSRAIGAKLETITRKREKGSETQNRDLGGRIC